MGKLVWDQDGERLYETGVKHGVLYLRDSNGKYVNGVAWNGLTSISENPEGAEANALYADDIKYLNLVSAEDFGCTIEAYTYPDEWGQCDGSAEIATGVSLGQQPRKMFGLSYQTTLGNDIQNNDYGYKIHCVYGALAAPSEKSYETINDSPEAITFSWEVKTTPVVVEGYKPAAHLEINSTKADADKLKNLEAVLYGAPEFDASSTYKVGDIVEYTTGTGQATITKAYKCKTAISTAAAWDSTKWDEIAEAGPRLPLPDEIITIMGTQA